MEIFKKNLIFLVVGLVVFLLRYFVFAGLGEGLDVREIEGEVFVYGCVVSEVDVRDDNVKYTFEVEGVFDHGGFFDEPHPGGVVRPEFKGVGKFHPGGKLTGVRKDGAAGLGQPQSQTWIQVYGKILVTAPKYPLFNYNDCFIVFGELKEPPLIEDFDYGKYLARYDIYRIIYAESIEKVGEREASVVNVFFEKIYFLKGVFEQRLSEVFAEPHASFMSGLLLGSRKGIPDNLMEDFEITGLTHIIAISGYNVTLVIVVFGGGFGFLGRRRKVIVSGVFVVLFVIFVGMSASVVRAGIMGCISLMALYFGRQYIVTISLFVSAFLMVLWNYKILNDVGFQLSFLATCGIVYCVPFVSKYFKWLPEFLGVRESVVMTLSAQVFVLPVIVWHFGRISLISPIANLFVLPFIPIAMIFGFFAVMGSFVFEFFGNVIGFFGYLILELMIVLVEFFASFSFASIEVF